MQYNKMSKEKKAFHRGFKKGEKVGYNSGKQARTELLQKIRDLEEENYNLKNKIRQQSWRFR